MSNALEKMLGAARAGKAKKEDPERKSRYTVEVDRWDRKSFEKILDSQPELATARKKLADNIAGELGFDEGADAFWMLNKVAPLLADDTEIRPSRLLNKRVNEQMVDLPQYNSVRRWTQGDPVASALAFEKLEPDIETLYDRMQDEMEKQKEYEEKLQQAMQAASDAKSAEDMLNEWLEANEGEGEEGEGDQEEKEKLEAAAAEADQNADDAAAAAQAALSELEQALDSRSGDIQAALGHGLDEADKNLEMLNNMSISWGQEPGALMRLPAEKRLELARRLNTPKFANMSRLIGPMIRDAFAEQKRKVTNIPEEIIDLEIGDDLPRVIPPELARLGLTEETELLFFKDLVEHNLVQYEMRGFEKIARGGIIYCHDGSGSMMGDREIWAKAVGLALLHVARRQKRSFYGIQFGSGAYGGRPPEIRIDDFRDAKTLDPDKVLDFAEFFFNGGTDFMCPLNHAVEILEGEYKEFGGVQADIVFATDGCCQVNDDWLHNFKEVQKRLDFKVWGIQIGVGGMDETRTEPLNTLCDGRVATLSSLLNSADIRSIFRGL